MAMINNGRRTLSKHKDFNLIKCATKGSQVAKDWDPRTKFKVIIATLCTQCANYSYIISATGINCNQKKNRSLGNFENLWQFASKFK